ncbi:MAG TPA: TIGR03619 family F420-dependent LLM class oxidoreductase [Spongiibacteraceae bacterium]|jgi:probable F420-dependent oxidoreductase
MRFTLMMGLGGYPDYQTLAVLAEAEGWSSIGLPDSLFFPQISDSIYPYANTEDVRKYISASPFIEPFVAMSWMAAITTKLRFYPNVIKVPVRQPLLLAKSLSSLAALSNNRITLGAGISPWKEDFTFNGLNFEKRGKLMDECIEIIRGAMSGDYFEYHSENYDFGRLKMCPVPSEPVPIIIGGHSNPALARAARLGDGWASANSDYETLKALIQNLNQKRSDYDTLQRSDFTIHAIDSNAKELADFHRLRDIGVTDICVTPWDVYDSTLNGQIKIDGVKRFSEKIISKFV